MNTHLISFALGGVLLLIGIAGGSGIRFRDIEVGRVGLLPRLLAGVFALVSLGFGTFDYLRHDDDKTSAAPERSAPNAVTFRVRTQLADFQFDEHTQVSINGQPTGTLTVDEHYPSDWHTITVPKASTYGYDLLVMTDVGGDGQRSSLPGVGQGFLEASEGQTYLVKMERQGERYVARLELESPPPGSTSAGSVKSIQQALFRP